MVTCTYIIRLYRKAMPHIILSHLSPRIRALWLQRKKSHATNHHTPSNDNMKFQRAHTPPCCYKLGRLCLFSMAWEPASRFTTWPRPLYMTLRSCTESNWPVCYVFDLNGKYLGKLLFLGGCTSTRSSSGIEPDHH